MILARFALLTSSIMIPATAATAQHVEMKTAPVPPRMQDVKTPAPPLPFKAPLVEEEPSIGADSAASLRPSPDSAPMSADAPGRRKPGRGYSAGLDPSQVYFDEPGDGRVWAAADAYKASFGGEGATYIPFFGSTAPRSFPVHFRLRSVRAGADEVGFDARVAPQRSGNRIVFDRGIIDEVYDLTPTSIEQSFVIESRLAGEVVIELAVESELSRASDLDGLVLASAFGSVRYGRAYALDASAGKTELASSWQDDAIRIVVPAERVAAAAWPLVIDPVIQTFDLDDETAQDTLPDVAYDASTGRWMAVYERVFSATDHDVYFRVFDTDGGGWSLGYIDLSTSHWANPRIANNNIADQFLCVAEVGSATGGARIIRGRTRTALGAIGTTFTISGTESGDKHNPDVGGDPLLVGPTYYCVVYQRDESASDHDILSRMVRADSTLFGSTIFLSNSSWTLDQYPAISNSDGAGPASLQDWNVVWSRLVATADNDLWGARIHWNGAITNAPFPIDETSASTGAASVSTSRSDSDRHYLVACMRTTSTFGSPHTYGYACMGSSVVDEAGLTSLSGAPSGEAQWFPSTDCDGSLFVVADHETTAGTLNHNVFISTFALVGGQITLGEGHQTLAASSTPERVIEVACAASSGGPPRTTMVVWNDVTSDNVGDIEAGHYEATPFAQHCDPGYDGVAGCPCSNPPVGANRGCNNSAGTGGAHVTATGWVATDEVTLHLWGMLPTALCIFMQGDALVDAGAAFGDGIRCAGGNLLRLATKSAVAGEAHYPAAGDPSIGVRAAQLGAPIAAGSRRYYFGYYRDPAAFACTATFNATNSMQVQW